VNPLARFGIYLLLIGIVLVLALVMLPLRPLLTLANFTMIFLLLVLIVAITRGTLAAFLTAFVSFVCINFLLVQPYYTLIVADPREVLDLVVFLIVAAIAGRLAANLREQAAAARRSAQEQALLYRVTRTFNQISTQQAIFDALLTMMREDFHARQADVLPYATVTIANDLTVHLLLLQADDQIYATLRAAFAAPLPKTQLDLLNACAAHAGMALHRIDLAERARLSQQYEAADKLKTALLHSVSHDLRTPITIIKTSAGNLQRLGATLEPQERAEIAGTIETEADHLDHLVGNLLDMSRLQAGALTLNSAANSLEELAGDVAARAFQRTKQERIRLDFPDDLPLVTFDYALMLQAVGNVVDNSLRYEPLPQQIVLSGAIVGDEARLRIINHGETITPDIKARMMEPFYHGNRGNIGLGLSIAKGIVEAHGGRLTVEDTLNGGATFVVTLPLTPTQQGA
jgi:two-component system, OmpR family, sensor histidine kinase KdpD